MLHINNSLPSSTVSGIMTFNNLFTSSISTYKSTKKNTKNMKHMKHNDELDYYKVETNYFSFASVIEGSGLGFLLVFDNAH